MVGHDIGGAGYPPQFLMLSPHVTTVLYQMGIRFNFRGYPRVLPPYLIRRVSASIFAAIPACYHRALSDGYPPQFLWLSPHVTSVPSQMGIRLNLCGYIWVPHLSLPFGFPI